MSALGRALACGLLLGLLAACSGSSSGTASSSAAAAVNPEATVLGLEAALTAAEDAAVVYVKLPACTSGGAPLCSDAPTVANIKTADDAAFNALESARQDESAGNVTAAQTAVDALVQIVAVLPHS